MPTRKLLLATALFSTGLLSPLAMADYWEAQPLTIHEWGVHVFDWTKPTLTRPELPPFIHTDAQPGLPVASTQKRIKDYPPDNGIRYKPVLYFYPPAREIGEAAVGLELRFAYGHANAWFPQASIYRTPDLTANAQPPDWEAWKKANANRRFNDPKNPLQPIPDDQRMELVWNHLTLSKELPKAAKLPEVAKDHWITTARQTQSAYVTNGTESEKFIFYEGATHENPAIAIVPDDDGMLGLANKQLHVVNVAETPIFNIFAIYHHDHHTWIGYTAALEPLKPVAPSQLGGAGVTVAALTLPDFATFTEWTDEKSLPALTTDRLLAALTDGGTLSINHAMRDPADPQGPTQSAQLYPDEAQALEKIWHDDFFNADGLTILYRESPAALDQAMPLSIYTDMYHFIKFSRCGIVANEHIDLNQVNAAYSYARGSISSNAESNKQAIQIAQQNRLLTEGAITYFERLGHDPVKSAALRASLDKN